MLKYRVISKEKPKSAISEQFRKLRTNIDYSNFDNPVKVVNLTSALPGEGKTMTTLNLAAVYGQNHQKTLLIDMDLRRPKVHRAFKEKNTGGLTGYLTEGKSLETYINKVDPFLDVMFAGEQVPFPAEMFGSEKVKQMMADLREKYDKIIIDCPPVSAVTDATIISTFSDATIMVVASRNTQTALVKKSIDELNRAGANVLGTVLNKVQKKDQYYGVRYNYTYGD